MSSYVGLRRTTPRAKPGRDSQRPTERRRTGAPSRENARTPVKPKGMDARDYRLIMDIVKNLIRRRFWQAAFDLLRLLWKWYGDLVWVYATSGWKLDGECSYTIAPEVGPRGQVQAAGEHAYGAFANACIGNQANNQPWGSPINPASKSLALMIRYNTIPRFGMQRAWTRSITGATRHPAWLPHVEWLPEIPPEKLPIVGAQRQPRTLPYEVIPMKEPDWERPQWDPNYNPNIEERTRPPERTVDNRVTYNPGQRIIHRSATRAERKPPERGEKEKKFAGSSQGVQEFFRVISRGKEALTEVDDFIDNIFEALPKNLQKTLEGRKTPSDKLAYIYTHWDEIDWNKAVDNIVINHFQDKVVGTGLRESDKAALKRGATNTLSSRAWLHKAR